MDIQQLRTRIESKITIAETNKKLKETRDAMQKQTDRQAESLWAKFKSGDTEKIFLTNTGAKETIAVAVREFNELSAGKPSSSAEPDTPEGKTWQLEKSGVHQLFYKSATAITVLKIAAAEVSALSSANAAASAKAKSLVASTPPKAPSATAPERKLTGLAAATAMHKQQAASVPSPAKSAIASPAAAAPARPRIGIEKAIAAAKGEKVTHDPPAEATGLQRAINAHKSK